METKHLTRLSLLTALALALSWAESTIPLSVSVPGVKLGLPNLVVVFALYRLGSREAWLLSLVRVALVAATFGNAFSLWYSLAGAVLSLLGMTALKAWGRLSPLGVSVAGGVLHNLGQILVAMAVLDSGAVLAFLPMLLLSGTVAGVCVGAAGGILVRRIRL